MAKVFGKLFIVRAGSTLQGVGQRVNHYRNRETGRRFVVRELGGFSLI